MPVSAAIHPRADTATQANCRWWPLTHLQAAVPAYHHTTLPAKPSQHTSCPTMWSVTGSSHRGPYCTNTPAPPQPPNTSPRSCVPTSTSHAFLGCSCFSTAYNCQPNYPCYIFPCRSATTKEAALSCAEIDGLQQERPPRTVHNKNFGWWTSQANQWHWLLKLSFIFVVVLDYSCIFNHISLYCPSSKFSVLLHRNIKDLGGR